MLKPDTDGACLDLAHAPDDAAHPCTVRLSEPAVERICSKLVQVREVQAVSLAGQALSTASIASLVDALAAALLRALSICGHCGDAAALPVLSTALPHWGSTLRSLDVSGVVRSANTMWMQRWNAACRRCRT